MPKTMDDLLETADSKNLSDEDCKRIFRHMLVNLENVGRCRIAYHKLALFLFNDELDSAVVREDG